MKKLASAVFVVISATALMLTPACGGDDDDNDPTIDDTTSGDGDGDATTGDGDGDGDGDPDPTACNPVTQTGCAANEKCAFILVDPDAETPGFTGCIADGTLEFGDACEQPSAPNTSDDCKAGLSCVFGACTVICGADNDCVAANNGVCAPFADTSFNMCLPGCDIIDQDCNGDNVGCYLVGGTAACAGAGAAAPGEDCMFANSCAPGAGCFGNPGTCRDHCGPWVDGQVDTDDDMMLDNFSVCGPDIGCSDVNSVCLEVVDENNMPIDQRTGLCITDEEAGGLFDPAANCSCADRPGPDGTVCAPAAGLSEAAISLPPPMPAEGFRRF